MIITTKNSYPLKTEDQEIFTASQFVSEGMTRRSSNTAKPSRESKTGEEQQQQQKEKQRQVQGIPGELQLFKSPARSGSEEPVAAAAAVRLIPPSPSSVTHPALLSSASTEIERALPQVPSLLLTKSEPARRSELLQIQK